MPSTTKTRARKSEKLMTPAVYYHPERFRECSPPSPVKYGPSNPYNKKTSCGRAMIARRDEEEVPTLMDRWLQANISLWPQPDPRSVASGILPDVVSCEVQLVFVPVRFNLHAHN